MHEDKSVATYWWDDKPNFGDVINVPNLEHFARIIPEWDTPVNARLISTGSILHQLPVQGWSGVVAGSGMISEDYQRDLSNATVLGLRGPLTVEQVKLPNRADYVLADPGLLASELVATERDTIKIGLVPHWSDKELHLREFERSVRQGYHAPVLIDPTLPPLEVISLIGRCEVIITSSLHGAIIADSFGIPRRVEQHARTNSDPFESEFKWLDYHASIGMTLEWGIRQHANNHTIWTKQYELFDMLRSVASYV